MDAWNPFQTRVKPVLLCSVDRALVAYFCSYFRINGFMEYNACVIFHLSSPTTSVGESMFCFQLVCVRLMSVCPLYNIITTKYERMREPVGSIWIKLCVSTLRGWEMAFK